jgi:excisionase family DNA binding protein
MNLKERELLTIDEAAEYMRLAKQTLYDYVHKKRVPYYKAGKKLLFRVTELDKWLIYGGNAAACERVIKEREWIQ